MRGGRGANLLAKGILPKSVSRGATTLFAGNGPAVRNASLDQRSGHHPLRGIDSRITVAVLPAACDSAQHQSARAYDSGPWLTRDLRFPDRPDRGCNRPQVGRVANAPRAGKL